MSSHRRADGQKPEIVATVRLPSLDLEFTRALQGAMEAAAQEAALEVYYGALKAFYAEQERLCGRGMRRLKRVLPRHVKEATAQ